MQCPKFLARARAGNIHPSTHADLQLVNYLQVKMKASTALLVACFWLFCIFTLFYIFLSPAADASSEVVVMVESESEESEGLEGRHEVSEESEHDEVTVREEEVKEGGESASEELLLDTPRPTTLPWISWDESKTNILARYTHAI